MFIGSTKVHYIGNVITQNGVHTEPKKIQAIVTWPQPKNIKQLRGFLGLTGYHRRFIRDYGKICKPLTALLKKQAFHWTPTATEAFEALKRVMTTPPVLALRNFNDQFVIEIDASGVGIGAVLMQHGHPIAYLSNALADRNLRLCAYERELIAVVFAVQK